MNTALVLLLCVDIVTAVKALKKCTDMVAVAYNRTVTHGIAETMDGDVSTAVILEDTVIGSKVYYMYVRSVCKYENRYMYNCRGLKVANSYEELKRMSQKFCWEPDIHIDANCALPTVRIINGFLYCQLEYDNSNLLPQLGKVDISTGKIVKRMSLVHGQYNRNCLRTRDRSWKPGCSGTFQQFLVHVMTDGTNLWVTYPSRTKSKYIINEISTNLTTVSHKEIDPLKSDELAIVICHKLYIFTLNGAFRITRALDLADDRNKFETFDVVFNTGFSLNQQYWLQYNPKLEQMFLGRPGNVNTYIFDVIKCRSSFSFRPELNSTFLWTLEPSTPDHVKSMVENLIYYYNIKDPNLLEEISNAVVSCPPVTCSKIPNPKELYCRVKAETVSLKLYSDYRQRRKEKRKRLQIEFRIEKILEQQKFKALSTKLHSLKNFISLKFDDLKSQINSFRSDVGNYFSNLAAFDRQKAQADIESIYGDIDTYNEKFQASSDKLIKNIDTILAGAYSVVTVEVVQLTAKVALRAAALANPFDWLTNGPDSAIELAEAIDELAVTASKFPKLITLGNYLRRTMKIVDKISVQIIENRQNNLAITEIAFAAMNKNLDRTALQQYTGSFLKEYSEYEPSLDKVLITEYTATLENLVDEGCDILFDGQTASSAVVMTVFASRGDCLESKIEVQKLATICDEMTGFQSELLEGIASFVRAKIAESSAKRISTITHNVSQAERSQNLLELQIYSLQYFVSSQVHKVIIGHDACNLIEYKNGGVMPDFCVKAIENPFSQYFDDLIAYRFDRDMCSDTIHSFVNIPVSNPSNDSTTPPGTLNLKSLYNGNKVDFQIPSKDWLVSNCWVLPQDVNSMIVIKRFEIYLPQLPSFNLPVSIRVTATMLSDTNVISPSGIIYQFDTPTEYNFRYALNEETCESLVPSPYEAKGSPPSLCLKSRGDMSASFVHPSVYAKWEIKAITSNIDLKSLPITTGRLKAGISICVIQKQDSDDNTEENVMIPSINCKGDTTKVPKTKNPITPRPNTTSKSKESEDTADEAGLTSKTKNPLTPSSNKASKSKETEATADEAGFQDDCDGCENGSISSYKFVYGSGIVLMFVLLNFDNIFL